MTQYVGPLAKGFAGDRDKAATYMGVARLLVQQLIDRVKSPPWNGKGVLKASQVLADGSLVQAIANMAGTNPVYTVHIESPGRPDNPPAAGVDTAMAFLAWNPEGFIITPRNATAPGGWGMPRIDADSEPINPPYGTSYAAYEEIGGARYTLGAVKQVIINKFKHNKYPDELAKLAAQRFSIPEKVDFVSAPLFHELYEKPRFQTKRGSVYALQFTYEVVDGEPRLVRFLDNPLLAEKEVDLDVELDEWQCHWPEELVYTGPRKVLFDLINEHRQGLATPVPKLIGPIKGYYTFISDSACGEMARAGVLAHESEDFRDGYKHYQNRLHKDGAIYEGEWYSTTVGGEVYFIAQNTGFGKEIAAAGVGATPEAVFNAWLGSPSHKEAIEYDYTAGFQYPDRSRNDEIGEMQISIGGLSGQTLYAVNFVVRSEWVRAGAVYWRGDLGMVSWDGPPSRYGFFTPKTFYYGPKFSSTSERTRPYKCVYVRGRAVRLPITQFSVYDIALVLGAALAKDGNGDVILRVAVLQQSSEVRTITSGDRSLNIYDNSFVVYETPIASCTDNETEWSEFYRDDNFITEVNGSVNFDPTEEHYIPRMTACLFSQDGTKFLVGRTNRLGTELFDPYPVDDGDPVVGQFYEHNGTALSLVDETGPTNLVYAMDYIDNTRSKIVVSGNSLVFPSTYEHVFRYGANDFCFIAHVDMQKDLVVDYRVSNFDEGSGGGDGTATFELRVNGTPIWTKTDAAVTYKVYSSEPDLPNLYDMYVPRTAGEDGFFEELHLGFGDGFAGPYFAMPLTGTMAYTGLFFSNNDHAEAMAAHYKDEFIVSVYQPDIPYMNYELLSPESDWWQSYSTLDLETITGVTGLSNRLYPIGAM